MRSRCPASPHAHLSAEPEEACRRRASRKETCRRQRLVLTSRLGRLARCPSRASFQSLLDSCNRPVSAAPLFSEVLPNKRHTIDSISCALPVVRTRFLLFATTAHATHSGHSQYTRYCKILQGTPRSLSTCQKQRKHTPGTRLPMPSIASKGCGSWLEAS